MSSRSFGHLPASSALPASHSDEPELSFAVEAIERVEAPPREDFVRDFLRPGRPAILSGLTPGWASPDAWTPQRVAERYGDSSVVAAALANGTLFDDTKSGVVFRYVSVRDFVASLSAEGPSSNYIMTPTWNLPSSFASEYRVPAYCADAPYMRAKFWIGKAGTVTPVHRDVPHNLNVHLFGRKRWILFPPGQGARMYPRGLFSGMPNFSEVDPENPDFQRHPRFRGVRAVAATVGPGETLFIPHGWWHHTRSLDDAVAMNFWWGGSLVFLAALASTVFKRLFRIRQNEWG